MPPKRNMALIVIVLIVDLALAGAGAYMLAEGLREPEATSPAPEPSSAAPAPQGSAIVSPIVIDAAVATSVDAAVPVDATELAVGSGSATPAPEKKTVKSRPKKKPSTPTTKPVDPYDDGPPLGIPPARPDDGT